MNRVEDWDDQIDRDNANGQLDFPFAEAKAEDRAGTLREWPTPEWMNSQES